MQTGAQGHGSPGSPVVIDPGWYRSRVVIRHANTIGGGIRFGWKRPSNGRTPADHSWTDEPIDAAREALICWNA
ncbi:hypothetical protein GCM10017771_84350 [Streptomyces capitiformicae]|uniref:Uncharacterized protein n=1 Tax=Streptomyces capitiformicae TaxID=2014920 RepID=A0A919DNW6_9ACTN|nr:hypothetical protein GCM10017771_84350 [Streptomyces capitiformicae]